MGRVWTKQPPPGTPLRKDGLGAKLSFLATPNGGSVLQPEHVSGVAPTLLNQYHVRTTNRGWAYYSDGSSDAIYWPADLFDGSGNLSYAVISRIDGIPGAWHSPFQKRLANADQSFQFAVRTDAEPYTDIWTRSTGQITAANDFSNDEWFTAGETMDRSINDAWYYRDGRLDNYDSTANAASGDDSLALISIGAKLSAGPAVDASIDSHGPVLIVAVWEDRLLTAEEHQSFHDNPWQIFEPKKQFAFTDGTEHEYMRVEVPWTKQPPPGTPLRKDGVGNGLIFYGDVSSGIPVDRVRQAVGSFAASAGTATTDKGLAIECSFDSDDTAEFVKNDVLYDALPALTVMCMAKNRKGLIASSGTEMVMSHSGGGDDPWQTGWGQGEDWFYTVDTGSSYTDQITDGLHQTAGAEPRDWNILGGTWGDDLIVSRVNYVKGAGTATSGTTSVGINSDNLPRLGSLPSGGLASWDGWILFGAVWDRALSDAEWNSLVDNPWQIFEPKDIHVPKDTREVELAVVEKEWAP